MRTGHVALALGDNIASGLGFGWGKMAINTGSLLVQGNVILYMLKQSIGMENSLWNLLCSLEIPLKFAIKEINNEVEEKNNNILKNFFGISKLIISSTYKSFEDQLNLKEFGNLTLSDIDKNNSCPDYLLKEIQQYLAPALWLYDCKLPSVYNRPAWTLWYLQEVLSKDKWIIIGSNLKSKKVPKFEFDHITKHEIPMISPAFVVVMRHTIEKGREALLVIRGTYSAADAIVDINCLPYKINYYKTVIEKDNIGNDIIKYESMSCFVHSGMYRGAQAIIEYFKVGEMIEKLVDNQFNIKIIGHSLGELF